ncbi:alpha/beta hydrolase [Aurantimonas sp. Leaf443]|uniref:alpha/beta hydrolase n=1 Tax=Aurantimonas sp. Leaf443 TaxID=1736378 RepID=UPI00070149D9|nr:alpha/beta hydrolase [Aurantimonas sp. Leaf443]KQT85917.1 lipase [Aurantimonas sp. Leaf443]
MTVPFRRPFRALVAAGLGLSLTACVAALDAATPKSGYTVVEDLRYRPGARGTYDLYVPQDARPDSPVVVFFYGGSWDTGSKDIYGFLGQALASQGIVVAVPDYRLYPQVTFPGFVEDGAEATAAVAALAAEGGSGVPAGRHRLYLMGHSAGAEIAGLLATDARYLTRRGLSPARLSGFVGLAGPYDFLPLTEARYERIFPEAVRADSQPVNFVNGDEPPMLLIAGEADTTVNPKNTRSLAARVTAEGGQARVLLRPGVDHVGAVTAFATALPLQDRTIRDAAIAFIRESR